LLLGLSPVLAGMWMVWRIFDDARITPDAVSKGDSVNTSDGLNFAVSENTPDPAKTELAAKIVALSLFDAPTGTDLTNTPVGLITREAEKASEGLKATLGLEVGVKLFVGEGEWVRVGDGVKLFVGVGEWLRVGDGVWLRLDVGEGDLLTVGEGDLLTVGEGDLLTVGEGDLLTVGEGDLLRVGEGDLLRVGASRHEYCDRDFAKSRQPSFSHR
jgi:hypothetical protein